MEIGTKIVAISEVPYHPFIGHNERSAKFIEIEVIEERTGKGEFTGKESKGYLGKGSDGYLYGYNYPHTNEGYSSTPWIRFCPDEEFNKLTEDEKNEIVKDYMWHDIIHYQCPAKANFCKDKTYISYCEIHQHHYYNECFRCKHDLGSPKIIMNMQEHNWKGWY